MSHDKPAKPPAARTAPPKKDARADALRANLLKRKQQARARDSHQEEKN